VLKVFFRGYRVNPKEPQDLKDGDDTPIELNFGNTTKWLHVQWKKVCGKMFMPDYFQGVDLSWSFEKTKSGDNRSSHIVWVKLGYTGSSILCSKLKCCHYSGAITRAMGGNMEGLVHLRDHPVMDSSAGFEAGDKVSDAAPVIQPD
jgi:hypothetical protein